MTGTAWIDESGFIEGPIMLTNTHSVGTVRDAVIAYRVAQGDADASGYWWSLPVVAETWDGYLNDINGFHVKPEHAVQAINNAKSGPVTEGNVGGGSGMICHEFKCGIGTASRHVSIDGKSYTVGVLVQANYGLRDSLRIAGVPIGQHLRNDRVYSEEPAKPAETGSIIIIVATDAPLLPTQLRRIAKRATMGLARMGSYAGNGSGDIFAAFSTTKPNTINSSLSSTEFIGNDSIDPLFEATVQATEESIVNAMIAADDILDGIDGHYAKAIDERALIDLLKQYQRYQPPSGKP
jgi:D-aminopeptidase